MKKKTKVILISSSVIIFLIVYKKTFIKGENKMKKDYLWKRLDCAAKCNISKNGVKAQPVENESIEPAPTKHDEIPSVAEEINKAADNAHLNELKKYASAFSEEEADVIVRELVKKHPDVVYMALLSEFKDMKCVLTTLSNVCKNVD